MAGTVTETRTQNPGKIKTERIVRLEMVSDDTDGTIPSHTISGLTKYNLFQVKTIPSEAPNAPEAAFRVYITMNGARFFLGSSMSATVSGREGGHIDVGYYEPIEGDLELTIVQTANTNAADIGNEKELAVELTFVRRVQ